MIESVLLLSPMLKKSASLFLIVSLLATNFSWCFIYAGFEVNQQYIATKLCINKSKPQLNCKGKCYLAKKIKQAEEKEKNDERQSQKNRFQEAIFDNIVLPGQLFCTLIKHVFYNNPIYLPENPSSFFHPPNA